MYGREIASIPTSKYNYWYVCIISCQFNTQYDFVNISVDTYDLEALLGILIRCFNIISKQKTQLLYLFYHNLLYDLFFNAYILLKKEATLNCQVAMGSWQREFPIIIIQFSFIRLTYRLNLVVPGFLNIIYVYIISQFQNRNKKLLFGCELL